MGQVGFIFFAVVGFWLGKEAQDVNQLAEALVPVLAEVGPQLLEMRVQLWQAVCLELLPSGLYS